MIKQIFLFALLLSSSTYLFSANPIDNFLYGPGKKDPRFIGLTVAGITSTLVGLLIIKKGFDLTATPSRASEQDSTLRYIIDKFSNVCSRSLGLGISACGAVLTVGGITLITGNKELLTQFEKAASRIFNY